MCSKLTARNFRIWLSFSDFRDQPWTGCIQVAICLKVHLCLGTMILHLHWIWLSCMRISSICNWYFFGHMQYVCYTFPLWACHRLRISTLKGVKMINQTLRLRRMLKSPMSWMKRMTSQLTKSELAGRSIRLPPLRFYVWNVLHSLVCQFFCVEWLLCQLWDLHYLLTWYYLRTILCMVTGGGSCVLLVHNQWGWSSWQSVRWGPPELGSIVAFSQWLIWGLLVFCSNFEAPKRVSNSPFVMEITKGKLGGMSSPTCILPIYHGSVWLTQLS
jgi:hypothetical protein